MTSLLAVSVSMAAVSAAAAISDTRTGLIPNRLTLSTLALAPLAHLAMGGPAALGWSLCAAAVCSLVPLWLCLRGAMGGGDLKLFAALGALGGVELGLRIQLLSYTVVAAVAVVVLWRRRRLLSSLRASLQLLVSWLPRVDTAPPPREALTELRMGSAIFVATLCGIGGDLWQEIA